MSTDRSVAVGIEIGGSQTTIALVNRWGCILARCHAKTLRGRSTAATLEPYLRAVDTMLACASTECLSVCGLGLSIPGSLDHTSRRPLLIPTLPCLNGFPLCELFETRYSLPAHLHVDVDAAALGEYHFGAGKGSHRLLFLTVNPVVGASLVVDGQLERSVEQYVGHVCHLAVSSSATGPRCSCGKRGCINTLVSMDAMQKMVQRVLRRGEETSLIRRLLVNREYFSLQLLAEEAVRGDSVALQICSEIGRWLGAAVTQYMDLFDPHILIFGGSILYASDLLLSQVRSTLLSRSSSSRVCSMIEVMPALLGSDASLIGSVVPLHS
jgi:glucokinase